MNSTKEKKQVTYLGLTMPESVLKAFLEILDIKMNTLTTFINLNRINPKDNIFLLSERFVNDGKIALYLGETQKKALDEVKNKIKSNYYRMEKADCICTEKTDIKSTAASEENFITVASKCRYGLPVTTSLCKKCGLLMTNPRMSQKNYDEFYDKEYRRLYSGSECASDSHFTSQLNHGHFIYQKSKEYLPESGANVLEIGCAAGGILKVFQNNGHNVIGIDLGSQYLKYGKNQGLELFNVNAAALLEKYEKTFDFIILSHVAEHFLDIKEEFRIIKRLLKPNGYLYVELPGIRNIKAYQYNYLLYFHNAHIFHFDLYTLKQAMGHMGFDFVMGDEFICSIFKSSDNPINLEFRENYYVNILSYMVLIEVFFPLYNMIKEKVQ